MEKQIFNETSKTTWFFYKRERVPGPEWSAASHFLLTKKNKRVKMQNSDVQVGGVP